MASGDRIRIIGNPIKSIQRGVLAPGEGSSKEESSEEVTISPVVLNKSFVNVQAATYKADDDITAKDKFAMGRLVDESTLKIVSGSFSRGSYEVWWEIIEFE